jgi:hypothetical protein
MCAFNRRKVMVKMSDVEIIGRPAEPESKYPGLPDSKKKETFTLVEASSPCGLSVHELKESIQGERLIAEHRGRHEIRREELIRFMKASNMPYRLSFELEKA